MACLALLHDALQRPQQQPIQQDRQHQHEEDDPQDRQIRKHTTSGRAHHPLAAARCDRQTSIYTMGNGADGRTGVAAPKQVERRSAQNQQRILPRQYPADTAGRRVRPFRARSRRPMRARRRSLTSRPPDVCGSWSSSSEVGIHRGRERRRRGRSARRWSGRRRGRFPPRAPPPPRSPAPGRLDLERHATRGGDFAARGRSARSR